MAEEKEVKRDPKLNHTRMKESQYVRNIWVATVEQGITREDLKSPSFWSHVSAQFRPYDRIEVRSDDGTFFAQYLILACERTYAKVHELSWHSLTTKDVAQTQEAEFEYKYRGPHASHSVIRTTDDTVMIEKLESKEAALEWIAGHKKVIG